MIPTNNSNSDDNAHSQAPVPVVLLSKALNPSPAPFQAAMCTESLLSASSMPAVPNSKEVRDAFCPLKVIPPPTASCDDCRAVQLLSLMDQLIRDTQTHTKLEAALRYRHGKACQSLRRIQGGRIEVFCRAYKRSSYVFDQLCDTLHDQIQRRRKLRNTSDSNRTDEDDNDDPLPDFSYTSGKAVKKAILDYAIGQACRDPRINDSYKFDNFSIIVNYNKVDAQVIHLDMQEPNFQFGLLLTDNTVPTQIYRPDFAISSVQDLKERAWPDMPASLVQGIAMDEQLPNLLRRFGDLLCPTISLVPLMPPSELQKHNNDSTTDMRTGTLLSLPGSVIHAGPTCDGFRAVLFFTAWTNATVDRNNGGASTQVNAVVPPYDPDTQYTAPSLISDMTMVMWDAIKDRPDDRIYLLTKLTEAIHKSKYKGVFRHLKDPLLIEFTKAIGYNMCPTEDIPDFIARYATEWSKALDTLGAHTITRNDDRLISADNMETSLDGEWCDVQIYTKHTYPLQVDISDCSIDVDLYFPLEKRWESGFCLKRTLPELFDGKNGELQSNTGVVLHCSVPYKYRKRASRKSISSDANNDRSEPTQYFERKGPSVLKTITTSKKRSRSKRVQS